MQTVIPGAVRSLYRSCLQKRLLINVDFPNPDSPRNSTSYRHQPIYFVTTPIGILLSSYAAIVKL